MTIKILANEEKPSNIIEIKTKGYDGGKDLYRLFKSLTKNTFVIVDKDDWDCSKAFFFNTPKLKSSLEEFKIDNRIVLVNTIETTGNLIPIIEMTLYIESIGGVGHSFGIETSHGEKFGWDGDGADRVVEIKLNGKVINNRLEGKKLRDRISELRIR